MIAEPRPIVLVTGSSGLIGTAVIEKLKERYKVVGLDIVGPKERPEHTAFVRCDISSDEGVQTALDQVRQEHGERIAAVIHLAAYYDFSGEPSDKYEQITVRGTQRLLRKLKQFEHVGQFIFSSTMLVHAPSEPGVAMSEEWPLQPKWAYPVSKVQTEEVILREHEMIPCVILRIAGVYDDYGHSLPLSQQMARIHERTLTSHVFPGDLSHGQALVHLEDLAEAMVQTVDRREQLEDELVLLIGEPETMSYGELQRRLAELIHGEKAWRTQRIPKWFAAAGAWVQEKMPRAVGDPFIKPWMIGMADDHYELDIGRARRLLNWKPVHRLAETLPKIVASLREDTVGWYKAHKLPVPKEVKQQAERERALAEKEHRAAEQRRRSERERAQH
ncbi:MAG: NAD(P)-dependent oxidoreductase [Phycisphaeraceae bacterium]